MSIALTHRTEWLRIKNFFLRLGRWFGVYLQYGVQIPRTHAMLGVAVCVCNSSTPLLGWKVSTGEPLESSRPASLTYAAGNKRLRLIQGSETRQPRLFFNFCVYVPRSVNEHTPPYMHIHTLTQMDTHTHKWTHSHTYIRTQMNTPECTHLNEYAYIHTQINTLHTYVHAILSLTMTDPEWAWGRHLVHVH